MKRPSRSPPSRMPISAQRSMSPFATGVYHFPVAEAAKIAVQTVKEFAAEHPGSFDRIVWVLRGDDVLQAYQSELEHRKASEIVNSPIIL